jgi:hypothetical protein
MKNKHARHQVNHVVLLKAQIRKVEVDTWATVSLIRRLLTQLQLYMVTETKNNIIKFNEFVSYQMNTFFSRGETSNNIITNIFTGFMVNMTYMMKTNIFQYQT